MLFEDKENEFERSNDNVINLTSQVTETELEQLLSINAETESCPGGVCQLNWRPTRRPQAA
jgi:hypothetical protein